MDDARFHERQAEHDVERIGLLVLGLLALGLVGFAVLVYRFLA